MDASQKGENTAPRLRHQQWRHDAQGWTHLEHVWKRCVSLACVCCRHEAKGPRQQPSLSWILAAATQAPTPPDDQGLCRRVCVMARCARLLPQTPRGTPV